MSLLTICQNVARETGFIVPSTIVGNTAEEAVTLLRFAQRAGRQIADGWAWTILQAEHTFQTVASTAAYSLPSDFRALLSDTAWDRDNYRRVRGGLTPSEWQVRKSALIGTASLRKNFRIKPDSGTNKFFVDPTPTAAEDLVYEYVSTSWCQSSGGTGQAAWAADTDTGRIGENLIELDCIWRLLNRMGRAYAEEKAEFERYLSIAKAEDGGPRPLFLDTRSRGTEGRPDDGNIAGTVPTWGGMGGATWGSMGG